MGDGFGVHPEELRNHAAKLDALQQRFAAVKTASSHIEQDDEAYGLLCAWIPPILEGRHQRQDQLVDMAADNLDRAAKAVRQTAQDYEDADDHVHGSFGTLEGELHN